MENTTLNFENYLFRCSSLGKLMVGVKPALTSNQETELERLLEKNKDGKITEKQIITLGELLSKKTAKNDLSVTTKNYLDEIHKQVLFKRKSDLKNKYLDKGIQVEEQSLTIYSKVSNFPFYKNEEFFKNNFICGTPDNCKGKVRDIKSSWDYTTFPFYELEIKNNDYLCQLNGYMELTGNNEAELIYCLVDTPFKIINDELRRADWKFNIMDNDGNIRQESIKLVTEIVSNMIYTSKGLEDFCKENPAVHIDWFESFREIPENLRVKIFTIKKDEKLIESLYLQIKKCREYLTNLSLEIAKNFNINE
jgi:hypothetical protein